MRSVRNLQRNTPLTSFTLRVTTFINNPNQNNMEKILNNMVETIKKAIVRDLNSFPHNNTDVMEMVLAAYNRFQEDERDGAAYLFDINNNDDLKCCIDGGMNAAEIAWLYNESQVNSTPLFYFGHEYETPQPIETWSVLKEKMIGWLDEWLPCMIAYPQIEEYERVYTKYVTDYMITNSLVY